MSNAVALAEHRPNLVTGNRPSPIVPTDMDSAYRLAKAVCLAGMAPRGMDTPEKCMIAIMRGLEVGLAPFMALDKIAIVNGRPTIWGDGAIGLVRGSGLCEFIKERIEGQNDARIAVCETKRRGEVEPIRRTFSVADAKKAGLWGKQGPWQQYPERMLQMRARAFALRDGFADVLGGLYLREEIEDDRPARAAVQQQPSADSDEPPAPPPAQTRAAHAPEHVPAAEIVDQQTGEITERRLPPPPSVADLKAVLQWMDDGCAIATSGEELEQIWNTEIDPVVNDMMPPDVEDALAIHRKHEVRFQ